MIQADAIYTTQQIASAAEVFVDALSALFPGDTFEALFHRGTLRRAYWAALQAALSSYATQDKAPLVRGLMREHALADPAVVDELLRLFAPGQSPDYEAVGARWAQMLDLPEGESAPLAAEAQVLFHALAAELRQSPPLRLAVGQIALAQERIPDDNLDTIPTTREQDLARLLDVALLGGPGMAALQVRHLLALSAHCAPHAADSPVQTLAALARLAESLPVDTLAGLWAAADALDDAALRARSLAHLAPHLERAGLVPDALALVEAALGARPAPLAALERAAVLLALAPRLGASDRERPLPTLQARALEAAQAIGDPASRVRALGALAEHLSPEWQPVAVTQAFEAAQRIPSDLARAAALAALPPHLPAEFHAPLLALAGELDSPEARAMLLGRMLPYLTPPLQARALVEALNAITGINGDDARSAALIALAPGVEAVGPLQHMPDGLRQAMRVLFTITREGDRARAFAALAPTLSPELLGEALLALKSIGDAEERARALARLAPHLSPELQVAAFGMARELAAPGARALALGAIAPYLAPVAHLTALDEALQAALTVAPEEARVAALVDLAPHLPDAQRIRALDAALESACAVTEESARVRALISLAPQLPDDQLADALACAHSLHDPLECVFVLGALLPRLAGEEAERAGEEALELARAPRPAHHRASALAAIALALPPALLEGAAAAALEIEPPYDRMHVLAALLPRRPAQLRDEALATARAVPNRAQRVGALLEVVPYLERGEQASALAEALEMALGIDDDYDRASALAHLAPHIGANGARNRAQDALSLALDACLEALHDERSADSLARLAELAVALLPPAQAYPLWRRAALALRGQPQADVLAALAALAPLIAHLGAASAADEIAGALWGAVSG
ncbi:MAG: hypothetical protein KJ047_15195 [Anaerolineae bacterium]|nr:hypothetical protein [Anaerolineae bacterium]